MTTQATEQRVVFQHNRYSPDIEYIDIIEIEHPSNETVSQNLSHRAAMMGATRVDVTEEVYGVRVEYWKKTELLKTTLTPWHSVSEVVVEFKEGRQ